MTEAPSTAATPDADPLEAARAAIARKAWPEAFELLNAADATGSLGAQDLEALALASFFAGQPEREDDAKERAFRAWLDEGDEVRAAYVAIIARSQPRAARQGLARRGVGAGAPSGCCPRAATRMRMATCCWSAARSAAMRGDTEAALALAEQAVAIAGSSSNADLRAWSLAHIGEMKIASGDTTSGIEMLEEASVAAVNGELTPFTSGVTACRMISACRDLSDYRRASEWIEATERYCQRESVAGFPGVCRVHRAEVAAVAGAWDKAETDLVQATVELERYRAIAPAGRRLLRARRDPALRGDIEGAEAALREAHARGRTPQPALALIRLGQGKVKAAVAAIEAALEEGSVKPLGARPSPAGAGRDPRRRRRRRGCAGRPRGAGDDRRPTTRRRRWRPTGAWPAGGCCSPRATPAAAARELRAGDPELAGGRGAVRGGPGAGAPGDGAARPRG